MKKLSIMISTAMLLLCGFVFSGCGLKEVVADSYDTWYKYKSDKQLDIPIAPATSDEDSDTGMNLQNAEIYVFYNQDNGLTLAVQSETKQTVSLLQGFYEQEMSIVVGGTKEYPVETFGKIKWTALWSSGKLEKASEPLIHSAPDKCIVIGGDKAADAKIQWKKVLANYLLNSVLEE